MIRVTLLLIVFFVCNVSFSENISQDNIEGIYVAKLAIQGPYLAAEIRISKDGTYLYRDANIEYPMPEPGCEGTYKLEKGIFYGDLNCEKVGGGLLTQEVDFSSVTMKMLKSKKGALVSIKSSALGNESIPFKFYKTDKPFF